MAGLVELAKQAGWPVTTGLSVSLLIYHVQVAEIISKKIILR